jgi:DNA-binding GntR family transcriptional regulator
MTQNSQGHPGSNPNSKINLTRDAYNDIRKMIFTNELIFSRPQESAAVEHQKNFYCIAAGDTREAGKAMREHIRSVKQNVLEDIQSRMNESDDIEI